MQTVTDCHGNQSTISLPKHLAMACQSLYPEIDKMLRSDGDWEAAKRAAHGLFNIVVEVAAWETGKSETHPFSGAVMWSPIISTEASVPPCSTTLRLKRPVLLSVYR